MRQHSSKTRGFSMIELVIVVVIIGIIAAIAIPRMSRGGYAGAGDSALTANLATLRNAIDLYQTEHGGTYPDITNVVGQLTTYTDDSGAPVGSKDSTHIYGPYIRSIPTLPVGSNKGSATIAAAAAAGVGWVYTAATGQIVAGTTTEKDAKGNLYSGY